MTMNLPWDNKPLCEREVTLAPGQPLPRGSSLSRVHVNRPLISHLRVNDAHDIYRDIYITPLVNHLENINIDEYLDSSNSAETIT